MLGSSCPRKVQRKIRKPGDAVENRILISEVDIIRQGRIRLANSMPQVVLPNHYQAVGVLERQRAKQDCVDGAEHCCGRADAKRKRQHGNNGETRIFADPAQALPARVCYAGPDSAPLSPPPRPASPPRAAALLAGSSLTADCLRCA